MRNLMFAGLLFISSFAQAETLSINTVPTGWKLENYFGDYIVVFFSGSVCANGKFLG